LQKTWWGDVDGADSLEMASPIFARPTMDKLEELSGTDFLKALGAMGEGSDQKHFKVVAALHKLDLIDGPLYYDGCSLSFSGRVCLKRLDADGTCSRCAAVSEATPCLQLNKGSFLAADGEKFRLSALGRIASVLLRIDGQSARDLEAECVRTSDSKRSITLAAIQCCFGQMFQLAIEAKHYTQEDGKPWLQCTIYDVVPAPGSKDLLCFILLCCTLHTCAHHFELCFLCICCVIPGRVHCGVIHCEAPARRLKELCSWVRRRDTTVFSESAHDCLQAAVHYQDNVLFA